MKFDFIRAQNAKYGVPVICRMLGVSKSGYYAWLKRELSAHALRDAELATTIVSVHRASRGVYGSPRVLDELRARGERTSKKRIARLMREHGISARFSRKWRHASAAPTTGPHQANVLDRKFEVQTPNRAWASDITYIKTWEGWLYLAVVIDLFSRRVVGWSMRHDMQVDITLGALSMALGQRPVEAGNLLAHSDRGSQYTSRDYQLMLRENGLTCSMSGRGNCWDNAVSESFFATLKRELVYRQSWPTRDDAARAIHEYVEVFYNRQRRHSTLGGISPAEFERRHEQNLIQAA